MEEKRRIDFNELNKAVGGTLGPYAPDVSGPLPDLNRAVLELVYKLVKEKI